VLRIHTLATREAYYAEGVGEINLMSRYSSYYRRAWWEKPVTWIAIVGALVVVSIPLAIDYQEFHYATLEVCEKERSATSEGAEYRIYTDQGTFVMKDAWFAGRRFDTADEYGSLQTDTVYEVTFKGWRVPILSLFPNIVELEKVPSGISPNGGCG